MRSTATAQRIDRATESFSNFDQILKYSPSEIRQKIVELVGREKTAEANAICAAGLALYPKDENVLAMAGLIAATSEDWVLAETYLRELIHIQNDMGTAMTWLMLVRALRCQGKRLLALGEARKALVLFPRDSELSSIAMELEVK